MQNESSHATAPSGNSFTRTRRRVLIYGPILLLLSLIQTTFAASFPLLGMTPDLCLLFVLGVAMFDGADVGGAVGIAAGFLESALGGIGISFLPLLFFIVGYSAGHLAHKALARTFPSYLIFATVLCILRPALTLAAICLDAHSLGFDLTAVMNGTLAPEFLANLIASLPMYPLIRKVNREIQKKN